MEPVRWQRERRQDDLLPRISPHLTRTSPAPRRYLGRYFGNESVAKTTVDHILSYMRSSPTWAYHGGSRSWGDVRGQSPPGALHSPRAPPVIPRALRARSPGPGAPPTPRSHATARARRAQVGNNGKYLATFGTGAADRGQMHYRSGLNMIPLIEWYRRHPEEGTFSRLLSPSLTFQLVPHHLIGAMIGACTPCTYAHLHSSWVWHVHGMYRCRTT